MIGVDRGQQPTSSYLQRPADQHWWWILMLGMTPYFTMRWFSDCGVWTEARSKTKPDTILLDLNDVAFSWPEICHSMLQSLSATWMIAYYTVSLICDHLTAGEIPGLQLPSSSQTNNNCASVNHVLKQTNWSAHSMQLWKLSAGTENLNDVCLDLGYSNFARLAVQ